MDADIDTDHIVTVTHFINPHLFWYRKVGTPGNNDIHVLAELERKLQELYRSKPLTETRCRPEVGDKVAVNFVAWNKFIRAEVLHIAEFKQEEYIVWATDYGYPLVTKKEHVRRLPAAFQTLSCQVYRGGLSNIQPAEVEYDHVECNLVMEKQEQWLQKACDMLEKLLGDAASIAFVEEFRTQDDHSWGELLIVNHKGHKFNARNYLQSAKYAMEVGKEFPVICGNYKTTKIAPWLTNSRKTNMKVNSIKYNIVEHSQQMKTVMIDEFAKRKVEDWRARNERQQAGGVAKPEPVESGADNSNNDQCFFDLTFDDSVSVIDRKKMEEKAKCHKVDKTFVYLENDDDQQQINYIGKAGALTKLKQRKYASKQNLPPQANPQAFEMGPNETFIFPTSGTAPPELAATVISSGSSSTNVSIRLQKLAALRASHARDVNQEKDHQQNENSNLCSFGSNTAPSTTSSNGGGSISSRMLKMTELRKKYARNNEKNQSKETDDGNSRGHSQILVDMKKKYNRTDSINSSVESHSTNNLDVHPYQKLEPSFSCTTADSILNKTQDTFSELSVQNVRAKRLSALRQKLKPLPTQISDKDDLNTTSLPELTTKSSMAMTSSKYKDDLKKITQQSLNEKVQNDVFDSFSFKLQPKATTPEVQTTIREMGKLPAMEVNKTKQKETAAAYDGLTLVPAGFDITRLQQYRNEQNHWHRKKSTRHDHVPHDESTLSSCEEMLLNSQDQSSSSSDFFQIKPPAPKQQHSSSTLAKRFAARTSSQKNDDIKRLSSDVADHETNILDLSVPSICDSTVIKPLKYSEQMEAFPGSYVMPNDKFNSGFDGALPSEISTSSITSLKSNSRNGKHRRQLISPTTQISKIDEILKQHGIINDMDCTNPTRPTKTPVSSQSSANAGPLAPFKDSLSDSCHGTTASNTGASIENNNLGMMMSSPDKFRNEKHFKNVSNYTTLMEVKHTDNLPLVEGEIKMQTKFIDHLVLAHSSIPLAPIENVAEAAFLPEIHEEMRNMRVNKVYRIQVYSWNHVLRGNSLFVVNPSKSGKTWSYLPALCSLVCYRIGRLTPTYGPVAIVLVASSRHVESINSYCRRLMGGLKEEAPTCVPSYGMRNFIDTKVQLLNGCGILITTPSSLLRLLKDNENEPLFDWSRLQHIVIDDMDLMLSRSHQDFESAVRIIFRMSKKTKCKTLLPQLIVTSRDWDGIMIRLMRKSNQPLLLIGDFLEAAVYGRATLSVKLKSSEEKNDAIHRFIRKQAQSLQGDLDHKRVLIMCNSDDDVDKVMQFLTECGYPCLTYSNRPTDNERVTVNEWKNKVSSQMLICTDARFPELQIQNVQNLIHYSMPNSWTQFTTRFSALAQTYDNFVCKQFEDSRAPLRNPNENSPHSMILLDEENSLQLPRLVDFMRKHNQLVHPDILTVSKRVLVMREESRIFNGSLLCPQLMEFGECDEARCDNRHELTRYDVIGENDDIPCAGEMRIHLLKVISPTYYIARLLQHKAPNAKKWTEVRRSSETLNFTMQLDTYYRNENNLSLHWPPQINDLCIYQYADNFRRARILDAPPLAGKNTNVVQANLKVTLKLIDEGSIISAVKCNELYICDDKFKDFPAQAIDIRLMHIVPFDNERSWDSKTTKQVQKWIMEEVNASHVVHVSINFALANTVWVKNVVVMEELATLGTYRQFVNLKMSLLKKNFATIYNGERKHVRDIAQEYGLLKVTTGGSTNQAANDFVDDLSVDDYQSCQNESNDLMKFSSSNGEDTSINSSMRSATNFTPDGGNGGDKEINKELNTVEDKERSEDKQFSSTTTKSTILEENWDDMLDDYCGSNGKRNEVFVPLVKDEDKRAINTKTVASASSQSEPSSSGPKCESWTQLPLNELTKVEIGDEGENGNWENIFLQIIDRKHMQMFDDLVDLINKHVIHLQSLKDESAKRVYEFEPLHNCIVKYNNIYLRAKVHGVFGTNVKERLYRFFLCDYACFTNVKSNDLYNDCFYETTDEIVQFIPYQSVHCTLAGVQWDRFTKRYQVLREYLYACAVEERNGEERKVLSLQNLPIRSYRILLFECVADNEFSTAEMFNKTLLDIGITTADEVTKHYLDYKIEVVDGDGQVVEEVNRRASSSEDEVYTFEQLLTSIQKCHALDEIDNTLFEETTNAIKDIKVPDESKIVEEKKPETSKDSNIKKASPEKFQMSLNSSGSRETDDDDEDHCTTDSDNRKSSVSLASSNDTLDVVEPLPPLKALNKRPMTTWYETDCLIFLSIHAPDITNYNLEVTQQTLQFTTQINGDNYALNLYLLGSIDPETVSHEIKGLNVVVRLLKKIYIKWPRLLREPTKYSWLKYNYNSFDSTDLEHIAPERRLQALLENASHINEANLYEELDSEDSERDRFETYNTIENNDDCYDPFA